MGRGIFLRDDMPPAVGEVFRNALLADTLSLIAQEGADAFYRGPIAKSILQTSDQPGRNDGRRRPGRVSGRVGRASCNHLPGMDHLRNAA